MTIMKNTTVFDDRQIKYWSIGLDVEQWQESRAALEAARSAGLQAGTSATIKDLMELNQTAREREIGGCPNEIGAAIGTGARAPNYG